MILDEDRIPREARMIPIGDDNTDRHRTPYVTWMLIAFNVFVFVVDPGHGLQPARLCWPSPRFPPRSCQGRDIAAVIPVRDPYGRVVDQVEILPTPIPVYLTLLTAMFMHGGFAHLLGNMLYLWIFGDNLEDAMGHARYLAFYVATGSPPASRTSWSRRSSATTR